MKVSKTTDEKLRDLYPLLNTEQECVLDKKMNQPTVIVVKQTPNRIYTTVKSSTGYSWDVMTKRLTPCI